MPCYKPLKCFYPVSGGQPLFQKPTDIATISGKLPCKQCLGCRIDREEEWAIRLMHECQQSENNHFLTLTLDDDHLPKNKSLDHEIIKLFHKKLRKQNGPIRFFIAGEYGPETSRPHWHGIYFGLELTDLEHEGTHKGNKYYGSQILDKIWGNGHIVIGENVTRQTCVYTAGYMLKDVNKEWKTQYSLVDPETGELIPRKKPYAQMSRRPGIAKDWYDQYNTDVFPHDFVVTKQGKKQASPAYYRRMLKEENPELYEKILANRKEALNNPTYKWNNSPERLAVRQKVKDLNFKSMTERGL